MALEVLPLGDPRWDAVLARAEADVGYLQGFCRFHLERAAGSAMMFYFEDELGAVFDVTLARDVSRLPFFATVAHQFDFAPVDLASPEYNGPTFAGPAQDPIELMRRYRAAVDRYCRDHHVVTEFVRVAPLSGAAAALEQVEELQTAGDLIYVDLREGYEQARKNYSSKRRQELNRAVRNGAAMRIVPADDEHIGRFIRLYGETMERKQTKSVYFFPPEFFFGLFRALGERALLVEAYAQERLASSTIFYLGWKRVWAQYEGTVYELRDTDANLHKTDRMVAWAAENGYDYLLLGGGFAGGDGGYGYKLRFSRCLAPVRHLRKVHDGDLLRRLLEAKAEYERSRGRTARLDYFPSYWLD